VEKEELGKSKSHDHLTTIDQLYVQLNAGVDRLIFNQSKQSNKELRSVRKEVTNESLLPLNSPALLVAQMTCKYEETVRKGTVEKMSSGVEYLYLRLLLLH